jgi:hypothetical protein
MRGGLSFMDRPATFSYELAQRPDDQRWVGLITMNNYPIALTRDAESRIEAECFAFNACLAFCRRENETEARRAAERVA